MVSYNSCSLQGTGCGGTYLSAQLFGKQIWKVHESGASLGIKVLSASLKNKIKIKSLGYGLREVLRATQVQKKYFIRIQCVRFYNLFSKEIIFLVIQRARCILLPHKHSVVVEREGW
jgi:hypothetical protein